MNLYYKFTTTGLDTAIKGKVYSLQSTVKDDHGNGDSSFTTNKLKMPLYGGFYATPLFLQTLDGIGLTIHEAIATITKSKEIKSTPLVAGKGTVKEYISDKDIDLSIIIGIVATDDQGNIVDEYPESGIKDLQKILDRNESILVFSSFLSLFGIDGGSLKVVVTEYSLTQQTAYNRQTITIKAVSDFDNTIYSVEN